MFKEIKTEIEDLETRIRVESRLPRARSGALRGLTKLSEMVDAAEKAVGKAKKKKAEDD